jgi:hypothetical protein
MSQHLIPFSEYKYGYPAGDSIGGRDISDPEQLTYTLGTIVKDFWPINEVPPTLLPLLKGLTETAAQFKAQAENLMRMANAFARKES